MVFGIVHCLQICHLEVRLVVFGESIERGKLVYQIFLLSHWGWCWLSCSSQFRQVAAAAYKSNYYTPLLHQPPWGKFLSEPVWKEGLGGSTSVKKIVKTLET